MRVDELTLAPGCVAWAHLDPSEGREQGGRRPVVVVSSQRYLDVVDSLVMVMPITTTDRGWPNHVVLSGPTGLTRNSWIMTEQVRTLSRSRIRATAGMVDATCLATARMWLADFLDFAPLSADRTVSAKN